MKIDLCARGDLYTRAGRSWRKRSTKLKFDLWEVDLSCVHCISIPFHEFSHVDSLIATVSCNWIVCNMYSVEIIHYCVFGVVLYISIQTVSPIKNLDKGPQVKKKSFLSHWTFILIKLFKNSKLITYTSKHLQNWASSCSLCNFPCSFFLIWKCNLSQGQTKYNLF